MCFAKADCMLQSEPHRVAFVGNPKVASRAEKAATYQIMERPRLHQTRERRSTVLFAEDHNHSNNERCFVD